MATLQPMRNDRRLSGFAIAAAGTLLITVLAISGSAALLVLDRVLREGPLLLWWCVAAGGYGHWPTIWLAPNDSPRMLQKITGIGVGFGMISLLTLGLGTLGWLSATSAYGLLVVGTVLFPWNQLVRNILPLPVLGERAGERAFAQLPSHHSKAFGPRPSPQPSPRVQGEGGRFLFAWLPIFFLGGIMLVADCVPPGLLWTDEPHGYDVVEYHLQVPREWYEAGKITPLAHNVFSYLPMNVEMHYLLAMHLRGGPWAGMYLAQMMNSVFVVVMILTLLSGVGWPAAIIASAVPWVTMLGSICYVEAGQLMWATLAMVWLLRSATIRSAMLAGGCAGFACGAKLTAVPMLVITLPVAMLLARRIPSPSYSWERVRVRGGGAREPYDEKTLTPEYGGEGVVSAPTSFVGQLQRCALFVVVAMIVFSPWLIRTFAATGNPIFPEALSSLGRGPFSETQQVRWERSLEPAAAQRSIAGRLGAFARQMLLDVRWDSVLWVIAIMALIIGFRRKPVLAIAVAGQLIFWLFFTHLQGRFGVLMLPLLAMAVGQIQSLAWRRIVATAALILCVAGAFPLLHRLLPLTAILGVDDFRGLLPQSAADAIEAGQPIALIGDAKAFWYQTPTTRLHYRTVFDVTALAEQSAVDHWLDPTEPTGAVRIIDDGELQRLCRTYYGLPKAP